MKWVVWTLKWPTIPLSLSHTHTIVSYHASRASFMMISYNCENGTIQCYWLLISRSLDSGLAFPPVAEERIRWQSTTSPQHKTHFQLLPPPAHTNTSKKQKSLRSLFFSQHHNNVLAKGNLCWEYYLFDCFYIRFKQWLNIIRAKWQYKPCKQCKHF